MRGGGGGGGGGESSRIKKGIKKGVTCYLLTEILIFPTYFTINNDRSLTQIKLVTREIADPVSGKLPTCPSPKPTLTLTFHLGQIFSLGEG